MSIQSISIGQPFFHIDYIENESSYQSEASAILVNIDERPVDIVRQKLRHLDSAIVHNVVLQNVSRAVVIKEFDRYKDEPALFCRVREHWPLAYDIRKEERLKNAKHYLSPKVQIGNIRLSMYHCASVPLNVGLHRDHPFCEVPGFKEIHTQIVGVGKMQQCTENDLATLYMEEIMAPGTTHKPMYDTQGNYPWHQYETITPSIFMVVEMLP